MTAPLVLLSILILFGNSLLRPERARCPSEWGLYGVKPDGLFTCAHPYGCRDYRGPRGGYTSECAGLLELTGRVYCTGGSEPITRDGQVVSCEARH